GYYQSKFQVSAIPAGGSVVRVSVQITAWYADPGAGHSGYQLLTSNGRLEADLLEQLAEQLSSKAQPAGSGSPAVAEPAGSAKAPAPPEPTISAPIPRIPKTAGGFSSPREKGLGEGEKPPPQSGQKAADKDSSSLQAEA